MADGYLPIRRGQQFKALDARVNLTVLRVSQVAGWADIRVEPWIGVKGWSKRQRLTPMGDFPYEVEEISHG